MVEQNKINIVYATCEKCGKKFAGFTEEQVASYLFYHQQSKNCKMFNKVEDILKNKKECEIYETNKVN